MPNWTTTSGIDSTVPFGQPVTLTSTYITIIPDPGYVINPSNFVVGGATNLGANKWAGGNMSSQISYVDFVQDGDNVKAIAYTNETTFTGDTTLTIDIDEDASNPVPDISDDIVALVDYTYDANVTYDLQVSSGTTITTVQTGGVGTPWIKKVVRAEGGLTNYKLFTLEVTPNAGYHLSEYFINLIATQAQRGGLLTDYKLDASGVLTVKFFYTETNGTLKSEYNPPTVKAKFIADADEVPDTNTIYGVSASTSLHNTKSIASISVNGVANTQYNIFVRDTATGDYYDWDGTWSAGASSTLATIPAKGVKGHAIPITATTTTRTFDVYLSSSGGSTLKAGVPTATGELLITQYGTYTISIRPHTEDPLGYQAMPAALLAIKPIRFQGDSYDTLNISPISVKGTTTGSSTRVTLNSERYAVGAGMSIFGENIPHGTTIVSASGGSIILSAAVTLAGTEDLTVAPNNASLIPLSFTIQPNGTTLNVNSSNNHYKSLWGFDNVYTQANGTQIGGGYDIDVDDSGGILENMSVTGSAIPANTFVSSINYKTHTVTINNPYSTISDDDPLSFEGANNPAGSTAYIHASKVGSDIVISGYLILPRAHAEAKAIIFIDDIINVT